MKFFLVLCALVAVCTAEAVREKRHGSYGGQGYQSGYATPVVAYVVPVPYGYPGQHGGYEQGYGHGHRGHSHGYSSGYDQGYGHQYGGYGQRYNSGYGQGYGNQYGSHGGW